jgi:hypothetical protein
MDTLILRQLHNKSFILTSFPLCLINVNIRITSNPFLDENWLPCARGYHERPTLISRLLELLSSTKTMSHLSNPLATAGQLYQRVSTHSLPIELQDSVRYYTARLTQAAGILLRLPQSITAQANVLLFRYWLGDDLMEHEFSVRIFPISPL